eukprot:TRINITY_DN6568_c0_g1_i1.p1 TRINITY_DN6568_c0_g1~~TRINITY_DN6568_c0_g1_i1.p1  ORF type:complete len:480 (+),score=110.66 TRINITY_DN6568_c0_g1_i1:37-1440(+)
MAHVKQKIGFHLLKAKIKEEIKGRPGEVLAAATGGGNGAEDKIAKISPGQLFEKFKKKLGWADAELDGTLKISLLRADGLKNTSRFNHAPEPYVSILLDGAEKDRSTKKKGSSVVIKEYFEIPIKGKFHGLTLRVFDKEMVGSDDFLGEVQVSLADLWENRKSKGPSSLQPRKYLPNEIKKPEDEKVSGSLDYLVEYKPSSLDGRLSVTIVKAEGIERSGHSSVDPYVYILLDSVVLGQTTYKKKVRDPEWNESFEFDVAGEYTSLYLSVWDRDRISLDDYIAHLTLPTKELVQKKTISGTFPLYSQNEKEKDPVALPGGSLTFSLKWSPPILDGNIKMKINHASDLIRRHSKINPLTWKGNNTYVEVLLDGESKGKTKVIKHSDDPKYDEEISIDVKGPHQLVEVVVWEKEHVPGIVAGESLGSLRISTQQIVVEKRIYGDFVLGPYNGSEAGGSLNFELAYTKTA